MSDTQIAESDEPGPHTLGNPPARRWRPSRVTIGLLVVILTVGAGGIAWTLNKSGDSFGPSKPRIGYGMSLNKTDPVFTLGMLMIERPGRDITVLEVRPLMSANVEFLGAYTVWPRDLLGNVISAGLGFPPRESQVRHPIGVLVPAEETAFVPAGDPEGEPPPLMVAAGFRVRSGDLGAVNGVQVIYKDGGKTVREVFEHSVIACVKPRRCIPPDGVQDWDEQILRGFGLWPTQS